MIKFIKDTSKEAKNKTEKADYKFDGVYFENTEKIGAFPPIINLKNAIKQDNNLYKKDCTQILENQYPQLFEFMKTHKERFDNFYKLDINASLTFEQDI